MAESNMPPEERDDRDQQTPGGAKAGVLALLAGVAQIISGLTSSPRSRAIVLGLCCLASLGGVVIVWLVIIANSADPEPVTLEMVLEPLDSGAYVEAREMAKKLKEQGTLPRSEFGGPLFAMGAAAAYEADDTWSKRKTAHYLAAARYLEEARDRGFPAGRRPEGLFLLGKSLYMCGQIPASRATLREALRVNRRRKTEIHRLLAEAYLNDAKPDLEKALEENAFHLSDTRLPQDERNRGLLQLAQILLRLGRTEECAETLDQIPPKAKNRAEAIIIRGQLLIGQARAMKND
ncbi:MAG: tetratricopeptide repeat protein, partial [Thermoguttaceae bacterium]